MFNYILGITTSNKRYIMMDDDLVAIPYTESLNPGCAPTKTTPCAAIHHVFQSTQGDFGNFKKQSIFFELDSMQW